MMEAYAYLMFVFIALEICCCIWLFRSFAEKRKRKNKWTAAAYMIAMLAAEWVVCDMLFYDKLVLKAIAVMGLLSLFMYRWFQIRYAKTVVLSMLFYSLMLVADYMSLVIVGTVYPGKMWDLSNFFIIYGLRTASEILVFGMVFGVKKMLGSKTTDVFSVREWCALAAISLITIFSVISITVETDWTKYISQPIAVDYFHIHIIGGILCINFIGYYLIHSITERELKLREYAVFREKVKNETAMYYSISENLEKQRKRTHEYKNQLAAISALAAQGAYQELRAYIEKIETALQHKMDAVDANHVIVNAILNTKYREAINKGFVFVLKVNDLSGLKLAEEDIVIILSNLLNNALEACEHCLERRIKFKFMLENGQAVISIKNSMAVEPVVVNGKVLTSKTKDVQEHGMGIQNVVETVEKYGGRYMVDYGEGEFQFSILIPNK